MEISKKNNIYRFWEKPIESDKGRDHCHLTGKYRGPAHNSCNINVTQDQSNFFTFLFHNFSNYDCHLFFEKLVDKKNDKVNFKCLPKTNEYISVSKACIRFFDIYRSLSSSLESLVKTLVDNSHKTLKNLTEEVVNNDEKLNIVIEIEILIKENRYNNDSIKDLKRRFSRRNFKIRRNFT